MSPPPTAAYVDAALIVRTYLAGVFTDARVSTSLRNVAMPDSGVGLTPVVEVSKATSSDTIVTLEASMIDIDVYCTTEAQAQSFGGRLHWAMRHDSGGFTADGGTIARVVTVSGAAERPYVNTNLVRVGMTLLVTIHGRSA